VNWSERIVGGEELNRYLNGADRRTLGSRVGALIKQQRARWPLLDEGYRAFEQIEMKRIFVADAEVAVQLNPKRIRSTAAAVDKRSVGERPCFLCSENLPPEEKGIMYGDDLVILCNPYPVLDKHLSIVHRKHIEQKIEGNIETLLALAADLGPDYFVLYNGPQCGASAPDHLHFQACSRNILPIAQELAKDDPQTEPHCGVCEELGRDTFELFTLGGCGRGVVVFRGSDPQEISDWFYRTLEHLPRQAEAIEPMINVICIFEKGAYTIFLFPRSRHRPACFFAEGEDRLLVSPGAIDMAGVVIVPEREHFNKLSGDKMEAIYNEVSFPDDMINEMIEKATAGEEVGLQ
jgi:uncharacterized protein DUF4922